MSDEDAAGGPGEQPAPIMASGRARRSAAKRVDYAKEQEFSDAEDIFEDSDKEEEAAPVYRRAAPAARKPRSTGRQPRKPRATPASSGGGAAAAAAALQSAGAAGFGGSTPAAYEYADAAVDLSDLASRPVYTEKGYDPSLPPIRERFPFLPEYEEDGSPKIELIVGRRMVDEKEANNNDDDKDGDDGDDDSDEEEANGSPAAGRRRSLKKKNKAAATATNSNDVGPAEYEYLVKYKGRSYLHLEWKTGADLESMNKSAKGIYRRYLKKIAAGDSEDLENPEFDPSYAIPEKIIDHADQEITVELSDKELLRLEKEREKELAREKKTAMEADDDEVSVDKASAPGKGSSSSKDDKAEAPTSNVHEASSKTEDVDDWSGLDVIDYTKLSVDRLRAIANREPYYPVFEGSDNPYRDGHIKEPPKKPRASYLFFQSCMRSFYGKRNPGSTQAEIMTLMGEVWRNLTDQDKEPFQQLAKEESERFDKERVMMEKAQRPNEVWQPLRRCRMVLDRLVSDSFSEIFLEPVDPEEFPDYDELIDSPMDLGAIREKLATKKYIVPEQFARDMRKVWNNCKIYNQHGSAIWHVADYMSKVFERLYHAWVLEFRERYLRWADPRARPWEHSCRKCDGKCKTPDDQMVLCDHCDAMYGFKCVSPPLKRAPKHAWHCPDCRPKLKSVKGMRMLSALAENAARKRAELGDLPKKTIKQPMYLVKWAGLGFEFCTWETKEDINDDALINRYHRLTESFPDEADMSEDVLDKVIESTSHVNESNAGGVSFIPSLRAQLYAQTRALQFTKHALTVPERVCVECGPSSRAVSEIEKSTQGSTSPSLVREVVECVADIMQRVERRLPVSVSLSSTCLPPPLSGEYDTIIPITGKGLMLNVGEVHGAVSFLGYRTFPDGTKGPAEVRNLIRCVGDKIIAVDGVSTVGKSFKDVIGMLRESGKNKFCYMRFLESSLAEQDLASTGRIGGYSVEQLQRKFTADRQRMVVQRSVHLVEAEAIKEEEEKEESAAEDDSDSESDDGSEGEFQPDSDDEEMAAAPQKDEKDTSIEKPIAPTVSTPAGDETSPGAPTEPVTKDEETAVVNPELEQPNPSDEPSSIVHRQETTRSLAFRLLDIDVGYSSDDAGDEDHVYLLDGVDTTFATMDEITNLASAKKAKPKTNALPSSIPARQNEFAALGERSKLASAIALTSKPPQIEDFDHFPFPSSKELEAIERKKKESELLPSPTKTNRSTVKVAQVSVATGDVVHVWANVESAAATLQLPINQLRQVLKGDYDEEFGDEVGGFRWQYALSGAKVTAGAITETRGGGGKKAKEAWLEFRDKLYDPAEPHSYKNSNRLRDYQVDGVNWLASTWYKRQGCILADEMGLGKTVQIVCYIEHLYRVEKIRRPYLVVVPLSTVEHWRREFDGWTDLQCCIYHDRQRIWRDVLREYEWYYKDRPHTPEFLKFDVLVTTYDTLIGDFDVISQIPFRVAVVDEAHRLRNQKGKLLECMREIAAKGTMQFGFQSRVLMSGTPLQNDLTELWTLLNFIEPFKFPDLDDFLVKFGNMANRDQVEALQRMISPFMLRRVKEDVAKDIPAKEETVIDVELTSIQKQYYRAIFEHNHAFLNLGATRQTVPKLMNIQMELRKVCNHPFLLEGVEHRETERQYKEFQESGKLEGKSPEEQQYMLNEHGYVMTSGKMVLLDKLLPKLRQEGHKVLIFSQVKMLDLISEYCELRSYPYERLDGRIRGTERQKAIDRFEREKTSFVFLLSTRAGGVGINLTAADICILFDSDWNPQNDVQAQARCHRIGQTKDVRIYRLVTSRSFEQEMFDRASRKLGLEQAVLGTFEKDRDDDKPSQEEMEQLLKRGAYALLDDDNDAVTQEFCADDIESILAKRTRTRVVEGAKTSSWLNKQGMLVSKSKFTTEEGDQLDMDDPQFWQKVMPDFVTPSILLKKLNELIDEIEGTKRGPGRGRWRLKRKLEAEAKAKAEAEAANAAASGNLAGEEKKDLTKESDANESPANAAQPEDASNDVEGNAADETMHELSDEEPDDDEPETGKALKTPLSRAHIRKIAKFVTEVKSLMHSIVEEDDDEGLAKEEQEQCQKLLLTISLKEKYFNEEQRQLARSLLKSVEGDRKRRCRTTDQHQRFQPGAGDDQPVSSLPEELMIRHRKKRKRMKKDVDAEVDVEDDSEFPTVKRRKKSAESRGTYIGEDGYLHHSDSEADWSDVAEDLYQVGIKRKDQISRKEAQRRRSWAVDDDAATAAGRPWPVFPRHVVKTVLSTILDEVMKYDEENGGVFSVPVPREEFPEYYEQIKNPMDYSTMKKKLENGEYRSAQAMQKDFVLILQNCRDFNDPSSDIVKEARRQHLRRPNILKEAALKHDLFLAEDGSVLEIFDEEKTPKKRGKGAAKDDKKKGGDGKSKKSSTKKKKPVAADEESDNDDAEDDDATVSDDDDDGSTEGKKPKKAKSKASTSKKSKKKSKPSGVIEGADDKSDGDAERDKPRIKIKVGASDKSSSKSKKASSSAASKKKATTSAPSGSSKAAAKRKRDEALGTEGDGSGHESDSAPPRKKQASKKGSQQAARGRQDAEGGPNNGGGGSAASGARRSRAKSKKAPKSAEAVVVPDSTWLDVTPWKLERDALDGTFDASRNLFAKYGPWRLPAGLDDSFPEIALSTLSKVSSKDRYKVFAAAVSESEAPDYGEIVNDPMDFGRMKEKVEEGLYGSGSAATAALYRDFLLVFDNCRLYNTDESEVTEEASRILALVPEAYVSSCAAAQKKAKP